MSKNSEHQTELELARWFVLSVQRYLHGAKGKSADKESADKEYAEVSGLSFAQQQALAELFRNNRSALQSLKLVLRAPELQNRLVNFGQSRDLQRLQITDTSKAFLHAKHLLSQMAAQTSSNEQPREEDAGAELPTIASRRAARRAAPVQLNSTRRGASPGVEAEQAGNSDNEMSDAEFSYLQKVLAESEDKVGTQRRKFRINTDRLSLFYGLLAGLLLFLLVNWLIL